MDINQLLKGSILLSPDNFTPLKRTPWAGKVIGNKYKRALVATAPGSAIGESWEFSCDPNFPSRIVGTDYNLKDLIDQYPKEILSPDHVRREHKNAEILVKLLNASLPLSLQVHPSDAHPDLKPGECGKPESWLVLDADPEAGIYLGFNRSLNKEELREIYRQGKLKEVLQFVEVKKGDYFEISPGVPHGIGPGVTLLEPQRVVPGMTGKTFRFWDWDRKYDENGQIFKNGKSRELHFEEALSIVDPVTQVGMEFVDKLRKFPVHATPATGVDVISYPPNEYYGVSIVRGIQNTKVNFQIENGYCAIVILSGVLKTISSQGSTHLLSCGQPALLPFSAMPSDLEFVDQGEAAIIYPASGKIKVKPN